MNTRPEITATLSLALEKKINPYNDPRIKKAKRHDRSRPVSEMLLMMFRSAARDRRRTCSEITQE